MSSSQRLSSIDPTAAIAFCEFCSATCCASSCWQQTSFISAGVQHFGLGLPSSSLLIASPGWTSLFLGWVLIIEGNVAFGAMTVLLMLSMVVCLFIFFLICNCSSFICFCLQSNESALPVFQPQNYHSCLEHSKPVTYPGPSLAGAWIHQQSRTYKSSVHSHKAILNSGTSAWCTNGNAFSQPNTRHIWTGWWCQNA